MIFGSTALFLLCVKTDTSDVGIIIAKEVPTDKCIIYILSNPKASKTKYKNVTVIKPPPIPNNPAKNPTGKAVIIIKIIRNIY